MNLKKIGYNVLMNQAGADGADGGGAGGAAPGAVGTSEGGEGGGTEGGNASGDDSFESLMGELDGGDSGTTDGASTVTPPASAAPAPAAPASPAPAAPAAPAAAPAAATGGEGSQPASPAPVAEPTPSATPEQQRQEARQHAYNSLRQSWAQQLTPEIVEQVLTDPAAALPDLFAQVELRALETAMGQTMQMVTKQLPAMIQNFVNVQQQALALEQQFFTEFPVLKDHVDAVVQAIKTAEKLPGYDFSKPEIRQQIAGMVIASKNLWAQAAGGNGAPAPAAGGTPAPAPAPMGGSRGPAPAPTNGEDFDWGSLCDTD